MNCSNHMTGSFPVHTMYTTDRLILKILTPDDTNEVLAFQCRNRELFERYEPTRPPYFLTPAHQQAMGYAREAVTKVLNIAFTDLSLHRVFARVMPENTPSLRLLEAIGFTCEGTEYACTQIQGKWKDHIRYALLNPYSSI